ADWGARGNLHAERRALTQRRFDPDAPTVHLDDLSGNGETQPRAALGARVRAVNLAERLEDPLAFFGRDTGAGIADAHGKVAVGCAGRDLHLSGIRELNGIAHEVEEHLGQALLIAQAIG